MSVQVNTNFSNHGFISNIPNTQIKKKNIGENIKEHGFEMIHLMFRRLSIILSRHDVSLVRDIK